MTENHTLGMYISVSLGRIHTESKRASDGCMGGRLFCIFFCRGEEREMNEGVLLRGKMKDGSQKRRSLF